MVVMTWKVGTVAVEAERPHVTLPQAWHARGCRTTAADARAAAVCFARTCMRMGRADGRPIEAPPRSARPSGAPEGRKTAEAARCGYPMVDPYARLTNNFCTVQL